MGGGSDGDGDGDGAHTLWSPADFSFYSSPSTSYLGPVEPNKAVLEKAHDVNDAAIVSEIDSVMRTHTDNLLHAIDGLSVRLSQLESRTHQLELSVDDLKVSVGNNHQSTDGEFRHMENMILEVQSSVQDLKVKQEATNAQMKLDKLQMSKVQINPSEQTTPTPQQSNTQQFSVASLQLFPGISPRAPPPQSAHPSIQLPTQYPPAMSSVPQLDSFFPSASQTQEVPSQQFLIPPAQQQQPETLPPPRGVEHQQYQLTPPSPYPQAPQPHLQPVATINPLPPQLQPEAVHIPSQTYPPSFHQPSSPPTSGSLPFQQFLGSAPPSHMYESLVGRFSSGPSSSVYSPPTGPTEPYPYSRSSSHYGQDLASKYQPHSSGTGGNNYLQIPAPSTVNGGAIPAGSGNRVPIDDVVDMVASMGFPREYVRATVRKLTDNGQAVDLNVVLDKLMNDGGVQPPRG